MGGAKGRGKVAKTKTSGKTKRSGRKSRNKSKSKSGNKKKGEGGGEGEEGGGTAITFQPNFEMVPRFNLKKRAKAYAKQQAMHELKLKLEGRGKDGNLAALSKPERRMKLFVDNDEPTDPNAGPFKSKRFGAIFLLPAE
ncbi:unnamed protein product [Caenorhabditis auriculariae]|uniref:Uncharacterized protein n=1 Tax=Caenorhabditis auriculariae TaxID=2777116 RepID=A0A8S1H9M5_9PELO|nr:unnamed protein product [Caenorhabditis auriculariae]